MIHIRKTVVILITLLFSTTVMAQGTCTDIVNRALEKTTTSCQNPTRNTICYGNGLIFAQANPGIPLDFDAEGDVAPIENFAGITHTPLDETAQIWGVSLMTLQADIPDTLPGQAVQIIVFGSVEVDDVQPTAFRFSTGVGTSSCAEAPSSGIMVRTPDGIAEVTLNINDVEIAMGSTAVIEANLEEGMTITMLDGAARVTAMGVTQPVSFSQKLTIPLQQDAQQNLVPAQPPTPPESWDAAEIAKVFVVYSSLNKIETGAPPPSQPALATNTPLPANTPLPTFTSIPTITNTPLPTFTPMPCMIYAPDANVLTRVGPGTNRGTFVFLEMNKRITVTGKKIVNNMIWWQLNKFEVTSSARSVNELWVFEPDVIEEGDCNSVIDVDAPPIIRNTPIPQPTTVPPTGAPITQPTSEFVPAVEPVIFLSVDDDDIMMGECTIAFVRVEFIDSAYFSGPGFIGDNTVEGPDWQTNVCPPDMLGSFVYTLDVYSLTGSLIQRSVTIEVR